jgi:DNA-binding transcriptional LysR family regulator
MISLELITLLRQIRDAGTLNKAAALVGKAPSALTYQVDKYESALGITLLRPHGRTVRLTEAALHICDAGVDILNSVEALQTQAIVIGTGIEPRIRLAVDTWVSTHAVMAIVAEFLDEYPNVEIQLEHQVLQGTWDALTTHRVDLIVGAVAPKPSEPGIQHLSLGLAHRVLAISPKHPLAKHRFPLTAGDLASARWIVIRDSSLVSPARDQLPMAPRSMMLVDSLEAKVAAQLKGLGVGFLPPHVARPLLDKGQLIELEQDIDPPDIEMLLAWRTDSRGRGLIQLIDKFERADLLPTH